uniref:Uncharacterized protein n=1 Tax=uncultured Poseidoniia archaeon TaxID=1697135 RepID=A0A1B1TC37_9ARCH|nr:hypothetical protein [uncultured Candidatus Thalassoarchaea sp.]
MTPIKNQISTVLIIAMMLISAGCLGNNDDEKEAEDIQSNIPLTGCMDITAINYDENATISDGDSCEFPDDPADNLLSIPHRDGCDNTNPIHCMLPFPSDAFLVDDDSTNTGKRISYSANTIPSSGTVSQINLPIINQIDGASPNTQIMTAFDTDPDVSQMAGQYSIEKSLETGHPSMIINQNTGELIPHWTEIDIRSDESEPSIIHLRTIKALDHNTSYVILFTDLKDSDDNYIVAPVGFAALRDNVITNSPDIEDRRTDFQELFIWIEENTDRSISSLQTAWVFNTASTESIIGPLLSMRNDALERIGENGIGCTVESNEEVLDEDGNRSHWMLTGTYTAPQYTESFYPPTLIRRTSDTDRTPVFVENREIPFWLVIPNTAVSNPADLTIWGHGFLGTGDTSGLYGWANQNNAAMLGTSFYGWSSDDTISIEYAVLDMEKFQHQAERLEQSMINQVVMIKSFMGVCADLPELHHNDSSLIDNSNPVYTGYSNGAIRGPSIIGLSPDLNRGVLWAGGSSFSHIIERCTQYDRFHFIFASEYGYSSQLDRAVAISIMQSLWDSVESDTFLSLREEGYLDQVESYELMTLFSIGDLQISNISSSRMMRTANIPILDSSTIIPYGIDVVNETHQGSVGVFFDGGYIHAPDGNEYGEEPHPAHNAIGALKIARDMAFAYLQMQDIIDTCNGNCTFTSDNLSWG